MTELSSAAFTSSYQLLKELINVPDASNKVSNVASLIPHATSEASHIIYLLLHAIEAFFGR